MPMMTGLKVVAFCVHISLGQNAWAPVSYGCFLTQADCTESLPYFRRYLKDPKAECFDIKAWERPQSGKP